MRAASSGARPYHANSSLNFCSERAGVPQQSQPLRMVFSSASTPALPANHRPSSSCSARKSRLSAHNHLLSKYARPGQSCLGAITCAPRSDSCAPRARDCPASRLAMRVSSSEPRSIVEFAPISTSSPISRSLPAEISSACLRRKHNRNRPPQSPRRNEPPRDSQAYAWVQREPRVNAAILPIQHLPRSGLRAICVRPDQHTRRTGTIRFIGATWRARRDDSPVDDSQAIRGRTEQPCSRAERPAGCPRQNRHRFSA